jgi:hypothetical protein
LSPELFERWLLLSTEKLLQEDPQFHRCTLCESGQVWESKETKMQCRECGWIMCVNRVKMACCLAAVFFLLLFDLRFSRPFVAISSALAPGACPFEPTCSLRLFHLNLTIRFSTGSLCVHWQNCKGYGDSRGMHQDINCQQFATWVAHSPANAAPLYVSLLSCRVHMLPMLFRSSD